MVTSGQQSRKREDSPRRGAPARPCLPDGFPLAAFRRDLLAWYAHARRDLPWRRTRDPWAVWVSEVMLQQTRVETVAPRFARFLEAFPDPRALAQAPEEEVLSHWSGLGYYSRARHLRRAAGVVAEKHAGRFPADWAAARALPGVGDYTAAAVLSICHDLPHAVVDGNVTRVLSRLFRLDPPHAGPARQAELAQALLEPRHPGDANQAMMELGATVCLPRNPACGGCPVTRYCRAAHDGVQSAYPPPKPRTPLRDHSPRLYLWRDARGRLLLERGHWPLLPHLWLPVIRDGSAPELPVRFEIVTARPQPLGRFRHSITRHRIDFQVVGGRLRPGPGRLPAGFRLCDAPSLLRIGRSSLLEKALRCEVEAGRPGTPRRRGPGPALR